MVNHNQAPRTLQVVGDLLEQELVARLLVLVVDSGSKAHDRRSLANALPAAAEYLELGINGGYAAACNAGYQHFIARSQPIDYIWFLNSDLRIPSNTLRQLLGGLSDDQLAAAAAPVALDSSHPRRILSAGVEIGMLTGNVRHRHEGRLTDQLPIERFECSALEGAALLIRGEALRHVGLLDESYFMYWEDTDWSFRARRCGWRLLLVPSAHVYHEVGAASSPIARTTMILTNRVRFMRTHATAVQLAVFTAYFLFMWLPAYTVLRLMRAFGARQGMVVAWRALHTNASEAWRERSWRRRSHPPVYPATGRR